jgi:hypothetical protein
MTNTNTFENYLAEAKEFSSIIQSGSFELQTLTSEAQLQMDLEFTGLWDEISQDLSEAQIEAICVLETERQREALNKMAEEYFSSMN